MTSYLHENEAEDLQMATSVLLKFLILGWDISRTIWQTEVSDGSLFLHFYSLSFELDLFVDRSFPLICKFSFVVSYFVTFSV